MIMLEAHDIDLGVDGFLLFLLSDEHNTSKYTICHTNMTKDRVVVHHVSFV